MRNLFYEKINHLGSAWIGHGDFVIDLVELLKPEVIVELGVDWGYSTFCLSYPNIGKVYGIDWFQGDAHTSHRDTEDFVRKLHKELSEEFKFNNLEIIKSDFNELYKTWNKKIDILHIDGMHSYDSVKNDFETWYKFCDEKSVILFHDTYSFINDVGKFFSELNGFKLNTPSYNGLGVFTKSEEIYNLIKNINPNYG